MRPARITPPTTPRPRKRVCARAKPIIEPATTTNATVSPAMTKLLAYQDQMSVLVSTIR